MSSRNFSVKATSVFFSILALGLAVPTVAQASDAVPVPDIGLLLEQTIATQSSNTVLAPAALPDDEEVNSVGQDLASTEQLDIDELPNVDQAFIDDSEAALFELAETLNVEAAFVEIVSTDVLADTAVEPVVALEGPGATVSLLAQRTTINTLTAALNSENVLTRLYAADLLWNLTGDRSLVLPTLTAATTSQDLHARDLAVFALSQLGADVSVGGVSATNVVSAIANNEPRTRRLTQDALSLVRSENRPNTVLGIIARESRRVLIPPAIRAITRFWR